MTLSTFLNLHELAKTTLEKQEYIYTHTNFIHRFYNNSLGIMLFLDIVICMLFVTVQLKYFCLVVICCNYSADIYSVFYVGTVLKIW